MKANDLATVIDQPKLHRSILGNYRGGYALGVTRSPENESESAFLLHVEGEAPKDIPRSVAVNGEEVPVIATGNFTPPQAL